MANLEQLHTHRFSLSVQQYRRENYAFSPVIKTELGTCVYDAGRHFVDIPPSHYNGYLAV